MSRPAEVKLDIAAWSHNLAVAKRYAKTAKIMAVVKANAYGHGVKNLFPAFQQADALAVICLEEALELRELGYQKDIILFEGFFAAKELALICQHNLQIIVHHPEQIRCLAQTKLVKPIKAWLKINTGMNRLGVEFEKAEQYLKQLAEIDNIQKPIGLFTHFSDADAIDNTKTKLQLQKFQQIAEHHKGPKSTANSAAVIKYPESHFDWVRPGIMLYGAAPIGDKTGLDFDLKPVMTLAAELIAVNPCKKGDAVGYSGLWTAPEDTQIGIVAIGYGDGYPRRAKTGTPVLVNNQEVPLVGRVSMDTLAVDLSQCPNAKIGDKVTLWGQGLPVERVAAMADTIAYELLTNINTDSARLKIINLK